MEPVSVFDFLSITGLRERDVLRMLSTGELPYLPGANGELLIDISAVNTDTLALRSGEPVFSESEVDPLVGEIVASEILSSLDEILNDALAMAAMWLSNKSSAQKS